MNYLDVYRRQLSKGLMGVFIGVQILFSSEICSGQSAETQVYCMLDSALEAFDLGDQGEYIRLSRGAYDWYLESQLDSRSLLSARTIFTMATALLVEGKLDSSVIVMRKAEEILLALKWESDTDREVNLLLAQLYNQIGVYHFFLKEYGDLIFYSKCALNVIGEKEEEAHLRSSLLTNIGTTYGELGDHELALQYLFQSIEVLSPEGDPQGSSTYGSIAGAFSRLGRFEKADEFIEKARNNVIKYHGPGHNHLLEVYKTASGNDYRRKDYWSAIENCKKALEVSRQNQGGFLTASTLLLNVQLAKMYGYAGEYTTAIALHEGNIAEFSKLDKDKEANLSYMWKAYAESESGKLIDAYCSVNKAISLFDHDRYENDFFSFVDDPLMLRELFGIYGKLVLRMVLSNSDLIFFEDVKEVYEDAIKLEYYIEHSLDSEKAKFHHGDTSVELYESYIKLLGRQAKVPEYVRALHLSEDIKSKQLRHFLHDLDVEEKLNIPKYLLDRRLKLMKRVNDLENLIHLSEGGDKHRDSLNQELFLLQTDLYNVRRKIKERFPTYAQYLNEDEETDLILNGLNNRQSILEFFVGENAIYSFLIRSDTIIYTEHNDIEVLDSLIIDFRESIYNYWTNAANRELDYTERNQKLLRSGNVIYKKLFSSIEHELTSELLIIPDGNLAILPFECLPTSKANCYDDLSNCDFLINDITVSYNYSISFLERLRKHRYVSRASQELAIFAPTYKDGDLFKEVLKSDFRSALLPLKYNGQEARNISNIIKADTFLGQRANQYNFIEHAGNYKILHLAVHAKSNAEDGKYSYIAFDNTNENRDVDDHLYANDLCGLKLRADMVVLSACDTGLGQQVSGEGVIGLARSFFFTGVRSLVVSLWSVNDGSTADFMTEFYKNISKGQTKSEALRNAKLGFLRSRITADPFFWAPFVSYGLDDPLYFPDRDRKSNFLFASVIILLSSLVGYSHYRK